MTYADLLFLASVLIVAVLVARVAVCAMRGRNAAARRVARFLGVYVATYAAVLIAASLALPRHIYAPGERRCFDDWCVAAIDVRPAEADTVWPCAGAGSARWIADVEISSVARRVRQRARDAHAELEDAAGRRYAPCATATPPLDGELGPGDSFRVALPFALPSGATPAGVVVHHGDIPGVAVIGSDQSLFHRLALQRVAVR